MEDELVFRKAREREIALLKLEDDITDINEIFKDLAVMIHDQGEAIDSIENNIERVEVQAREADRNIQVAHKNQVGCFFVFFCF
jgi:t-SNARE complex subunit (syntaxin)